MVPARVAHATAYGIPRSLLAVGDVAGLMHRFRQSAAAGIRDGNGGERGTIRERLFQGIVPGMGLIEKIGGMPL